MKKNFCFSPGTTIPLSILIFKVLIFFKIILYFNKTFLNAYDLIPLALLKGYIFSRIDVLKSYNQFKFFLILFVSQGQKKIQFYKYLKQTFFYFCCMPIFKSSYFCYYNFKKNKKLKQIYNLQLHFYIAFF